MSGWRELAVAVFALLATGCAASPEGMMTDSGQCDFDVLRAEAWVNRMPGPDAGKAAQMTVTIRTSMTDRILALSQDRLEGGTLYLSVVPGAAPLQPGVLTWRMYMPEGGLERIVVSCDGVTKTEIGEIGVAW